MISPRSWANGAGSLLRRHADVVAIFLASVAYGLYYWMIYGWRPGAWQPLGYLTWADQSSYLVELRYLAGFSLPATADEYSRGLGYPLTGVPAWWLGLHDEPFLPGNLLMLGITVAASYVVARRLTGSRVIPWALVGILLMASPMVELVIVPWSTTVTLVAMALTLVIATSPRGVTTGGAVGIGMLAGWAFAARYLDVLAIAAIGLWYLIAGGRAGWIRRTLAMAVPALSWLTLAALSQLVVHGSLFATGYTRHQGNPQSFGYYSLLRVPRQFWETFVTAIDSIKGRIDADPLFAITPLLVLMPVGFILVMRVPRRWRGLHIAALTGSVVQGTIYIAGEFGGASALWFRSPRFWIASYPYWLTLSLIAAVALIALILRITARERASPPGGAGPDDEP